MTGAGIVVEDISEISHTVGIQMAETFRPVVLQTSYGLRK